MLGDSQSRREVSVQVSETQHEPGPQADVARDAGRGKRSRAAATGIIGFVVTALGRVDRALDEQPAVSGMPISTYRAYFDDAGGLVLGDVASVASVNVGRLSRSRLADTPDR